MVGLVLSGSRSEGAHGNLPTKQPKCAHDLGSLMVLGFRVLGFRVLDGLSLRVRVVGFFWVQA